MGVLFCGPAKGEMQSAGGAGQPTAFPRGAKCRETSPRAAAESAYRAIARDTSNVLKLFVLPFGKNVVDIVHIQRSVIPSAALDVQVFVELPTVGR